MLVLSASVAFHLLLLTRVPVEHLFGGQQLAEAAVRERESLL